MRAGAKQTIWRASCDAWNITGAVTANSHKRRRRAEAARGSRDRFAPAQLALQMAHCGGHHGEATEVNAHAVHPHAVRSKHATTSRVSPWVPNGIQNGTQAGVKAACEKTGAGRLKVNKDVEGTWVESDSRTGPNGRDSDNALPDISQFCAQNGAYGVGTR
jgi:hypothetical protein